MSFMAFPVPVSGGGIIMVDRMRLDSIADITAEVLHDLGDDVGSYDGMDASEIMRIVLDSWADAHGVPKACVDALIVTVPHEWIAGASQTFIDTMRALTIRMCDGCDLPSDICECRPTWAHTTISANISRTYAANVQGVL